MKNIFLISVLLFAILFAANAQLESNIWYFGNRAGINFNSNPPTALTDGQMSTYEGCATISDTNGNLQFYTDGSTVWNKNHQIMDNGIGLNGSSAASQSSIILPKPNSNIIYYILTVDAEENNFGANGLQFSEVNISLNSGLGKVISKNNELIKPTSEKLTIAKHFNNINYWIITHGVNNNNFYSFLVSSTGINIIPVISSTGSFQNDSSDLIGYLKASNNSKKLASAKYLSGELELFDFNNATGTVFNAIQIGNSEKYYGVEFSPDNQKLYTSVYNTSSIYQYDLTATNIADSKNIIYNSNSCCGGALQIGLNNKIYFSKYGSNYLGEINNPNDNICNFVMNAIYLNSKISQFGLPNIISSLIIINCIPPVTSFTASNNTICSGEQVHFTNTTPIPYTSQKWLIDGQQFTTNNDADYTFNNAGVYTISLVAFNDSCSDTANLAINVNPIKQSIVNAVICLGETYQVGIHTYTISGTYKDTLISFSGCDSIVTTNLNTIQVPKVNLGNDTSICPGSPLVLNATTAGSDYLWQDGSDNPTFNVLNQGLFWVKVSINNCFNKDSINIYFEETCNTLFIPNAFKPTGINKIFKPFGSFAPHTDYYFAIYNRWGGLIFETKDYNEGWKGTFKEKPAQSGVYVYYLRIKFGGQLKSFEKTGNFTLID